MNISINDVSKSFGKSKVIDNVSMNIKGGEIVCFLGPSGSGKTTLMRLILGAIKADSGNIIIGDSIVVPNLKILSKIGYMPQNEALYEDLTAMENLKFFAGLYKIESSRLNEIQSEALSIVNLLGDKDKLVSKFSGGMKKRLSLAIALQHNPDILILDEPTVGIDPVLRYNIWQKFLKLKEQGKTLIVSTHVMDEVANSDKAALIYSGKLVDFDTVPNLLSKTKTNKLEELFFDANKEEETL